MKRIILSGFLLLSLLASGVGFAQDSDLTEAGASQKSMQERSLEAQGVIAIPDPKFITEGSSGRTQGVYFGVGFRQLRLDFRNGRSIANNDGTINGVAFNLGYFAENQIWEYSRHVTILDLSETLTFKERPFNFVEVIQNNLWYFRSIKVAKDFFLNYGLGAQSAEIRLIFNVPENSTPESSTPKNPTEDSTPALEDTTELRREDSLLWGGGGAYFITPDFFIQYRFTQGNYSPLLTNHSVDNALHSTQIHTLFLQYYFSL